MERERLGLGVTELAVVATARRLPSDHPGAFADWVASSAAGRAEDLSLGFNAGPSAAPSAAAPSPGMWQSASARHHLNYGLSSDMGVVGLRDLFLVAPFHQQQQQQEEESMISGHHHHHHQAAVDGGGSSSNAATSLGVGVIPLLTAQCLSQPGVDLGGGAEHFMNNNNNGRSGNNNHNGSTGIQFWQGPIQQQPNSGFPKKPTVFDHNLNSMNLLQTAVANGGVGSAGTMSGVATCQDCGNQAKKECTHRRCRTCCKNRGFDCPTHVKSTWVPASRRRERQTMTGGNGGGVYSASTSGTKKPRLVGASQTTTTSHTSNSNNTPPRSFDTSSSHHQDASFKEGLPGKVRASAVFKCVRVTAMEEGGDEIAYQAVVKIGGHVFKGFLYDQGAHKGGGGDHDVDRHHPNISELHLGGGGRHKGASSSPMLDVAADVFAGTLLGGSSSAAAYGNQIN